MIIIEGIVSRLAIGYSFCCRTCYRPEKALQPDRGYLDLPMGQSLVLTAVRRILLDVDHSCSHTYIHKLSHRYIHTYVHTHMHTYIYYAYMHTYIHTYIKVLYCICIHTYIQSFMQYRLRPFL